MPRRFTWLLLALISLLVVTAGVAEFRYLKSVGTNENLVTALESVAYSAVLLAAVFAVAETTRTRWVAGVTAAIAILLGIAAGLWETNVLKLADSLATTLFLGFTSALIVRHLFRCREVDLDTLAASICLYLIFGLLWLAMYSVVVQFDENAFRFAGSTEEDAEQMTIASIKSAHGLYFSFVTLTTLGYGDITPESPIARLLAAAEAITGQVFLTILVARLVGLHLSITVHGGDEEDLLEQGGENEGHAAGESPP